MESIGEKPYVFPAQNADYDPVDAVVFGGVSLALGIVCRQILRGTRVPYTCALLLIGIALGSLEFGTRHKLGKIGDGIRLWSSINPDLFLAIFLPVLLFESAFSMEVHLIKRCMAQMIILAGPGVLISTFCLGTVLKLVFPYNWGWKLSLLLGALLSATDPVAVVALLKELGASKKLSTIIEGESSMNDGIAIVVYQLFFKMVLGQSFSWDFIFEFLVKNSLGAVAVGAAFGIGSVLWFGFIFNDTVIEITLTLAVSYIAYFTAQFGADISGILAVVTLGMVFSAVAKIAFKEDNKQSLHRFWETAAYIANTLIFILSGVVIAESILGDEKNIKNDGYSWGYLILLYIFVQLSRCIVVGLLYPFLRFLGYGLDLKEAAVIIWAGLRGPVALSLSLSFKGSNGILQDPSSDIGSRFVFFSGGIVFLTLIVNGSTAQFLLHLLDMDKPSTTKRHILDDTKYEMLNKVVEAFEDLGDDEELGPADWPSVKSNLTSLSHLDGDQVHTETAADDFNLEPTNLKAIRMHLLNGVQTAYWVMLDEGKITETTAIVLINSVDEAMDLVADEPICDWIGLKLHMNFPKYLRFLQANIFPRKLITYFTVQRLETGCSICAAFLRAHRIARRRLHDFVGDSSVTSLVMNESVAEGEEARNFLEDVQMTFPQVLHVVKTRQVTYSVLSKFIDYIQDLEKTGLLQEKDLRFHEAVQTDLKKLLRNPPLVKVPKAADRLNVHPFFGPLPSTLRALLESSANEIIKAPGTTLYKEGSNANGIWLICNGVVKWTSRAIRNKHSLHPSFAHGSSLGLYEVLTGKPYFCDAVMDSAVLCFFIESHKVSSFLGSDSEVDDFLWQESAIFLAKLLLPQMFESWAMKDLRALVTYRSTMREYIRGEKFEMHQQCIGILLDGSIKSQSLHELITSPAVVLPPSANQGTEAGSSIYRGYWYQVETRARIILFDVATIEANDLLQRRPSQLGFRAGDHAYRPLRSLHRGLVHRPEQFHQARNHKQSSDAGDQQPISLSARAMQLSIFGTMVEIPRHRSRSFSNVAVTELSPDDSMSVPYDPVAPALQNVVAGSEGSFRPVDQDIV